MLVHPIYLVLSSATLSNEIFCVSFLVKNHVFCVPATTAKQILFLNHMDINVVGGKDNVLVHYVDVCAPDSSGVVLCNPFKWDILYSFLIKNHFVVFVPSTPVKWISFQNLSYSTTTIDGELILLFRLPQEQKSCRRQTQCSHTLCGCLCTWLIWCCPLKPFQMRYFVVHYFWSKIVWWSKIHTFQVN